MDKIRVLIVDDHPLFRQGIRDVLQADTEVEIVGEGRDGQEALDLARQLKPDAITLDINLPHINGLQVLRQVRREHLAKAVVMITAYDDIEQVLHAFRAGCSAYCPKDIAPAKLLQTLHLALQGNFIVGDQVLDNDGLQAWLEGNIGAAGRPYSENAHEVYSPLSSREMEILQCITRGLSNKEIAAHLGISHQTVKNHMTAILQKLSVEDRTQAAVYALKRGWVRLHN